MLTPDSPVTEIRGVGPAKAKALQKAGIVTVADIVNHFPRAYQNRGNTKTVAEAAKICRESPSVPPMSLVLTVSSEPTTATIRRGMTLTKFKAFDETGVVDVTYFNQPFLKSVFHVGGVFRFWGRMRINRGRAELNSPVHEAYIDDGEGLSPIVPVYPLSSGISQKFMTQLVKEALKVSIPDAYEHIPTDVLKENELPSLSYSLRNIHFPKDMTALSAAERRFAFDEIYTVSVAMRAAKEDRAASGAPVFSDNDILKLLSVLPFGLTGAQLRSIGEIADDMKKPRPMCRLLCGDVGSGKTAVAAAAVYIAAKNGFRSALMAPTEILAKQHYQDLTELFAPLDIKVALLCGSLSAAEKKRVRLSLSSPDGPDLVIGTHALLTDDVEFSNFGLVITDEQHRFGVSQRAELKNKSRFAHSLAMSATPIPRTLSLVIYGDLDVSKLDEMPPGRQKVSTFKVDESYRDRLLGFIRKQKEEGHRTYIVCPAIEENDTDDAEEMYDIVLGETVSDEPPLKAAVQFAKELSEKLPDLNIQFIHGKMKTADKDASMNAFARGDVDVLVSTTVIEVGVNVPEATLMIVENAERFGLSQLHQLRGRVGRGKAKSYCILVSDTKNEKSLERLGIMCQSNDGFKIAEADLKMRGPGDFFKTGDSFRQHGDRSMRFASVCTDETVLQKAVEAAEMTVSSDPDLSRVEHEAIRKKVKAMRESAENTIS